MAKQHVFTTPRHLPPETRTDGTKGVVHRDFEHPYPLSPGADKRERDPRTGGITQERMHRG